MFSEVRSRLSVLQRTDSEVFKRPRGRPGKGKNSGEEAVTEDEVREIKSNVSALRKQLHQIVDDEIPSNNEACGLATNGMLILRGEVEQKRTLLDELRGALDDAKNELEDVEEQCVQEQEQREVCRKDAARLLDETEQARSDMIDLRAEIKQQTYFQENVDTETMHRLRADVENLKIEQEIDEIKLRHVNNEKNSLKAELEELQRLRDAHQIVASDAQRELSEARMTKEMYQAHNEALSIHLQSLGGNPNENSIYQSMRGLFREVGRRASVGSKMTGGMASVGSKMTTGSWKENAAGTMSRNSIIQTQLRQQQQHQQQLQSERQKFSSSMILPLSSSDKQQLSSPSHAQVGGVILGNDSGHGRNNLEGSGSDHFLRKLPTIFKMGSNNNNNHHGNNGLVLDRNNNDGNENGQGYARPRDTEVEFHSDSHSISAISAITIDEDAWTESESEDSPD